MGYVEGLEQGATAGAGDVNNGKAFAPIRSKQYEIGFKTDRDSWGGNVALFRVDKGYQYTIYAADFSSHEVFQDGTQRFTGLDTSGWFRVAPHVRLMGGFLWLNTKTYGVQDPTINGNRVFATPDCIVSGRVEYDTPFLPGLTLAAGAKVTGSMYVNSSNTQSLPSYTTADISARYTTKVAGKAVTLRAAINNLFDKKYWTTTYDGFVLPASTRTFLMNASVNF